ncbi:hypothetical protein CFP56_000741 [Quercus suber]|uniref:Uncharacterized protein n=1 Tax=Quercus suber TaxID=58331 RepID=A0AAW0INW2_QUESU
MVVGVHHNIQSRGCRVQPWLSLMTPNSWIPSTKTLQRPLRLANSTTSVMVSISHPPTIALFLFKFMISKMFLLETRKLYLISEGDESYVREFQNMHLEPKKKGFGRLFHSPTLFEDAIKSILLCNCK